MSVANTSPLLRFLAEPASIEEFVPEELSLLFSEARRVGLLGRLSSCLELLGSTLPARLRSHVSASLVEVDAFQRDVLRELNYIEVALAGLGARVLLLKGASYIRTSLQAAKGRIFSDIDILVAKEWVGQAEASLMLGGWQTGELDQYDQRYYREWSHEVPPMTNRLRGTTIDIHHALAMPTCRIRIDSEKMVMDATPIDNSGFWWRLKDEDMVLHAASHLMLNSEFDRGLRDLWDIDLLFRQFFESSVSFPDRLIERAGEVGLEEIACQALFLARQFIGTPIPDRIISKQGGLFVHLVGCAASTRHMDTRPCWQGVADALLSYREMYLRLPNRLLVAHLAHKTADFLGLSAKEPIARAQL
jgi:hypothetical protein